MSFPGDISQIVERICGRDSRYHGDAYEFVLVGLQHTVRRLNRKGHVSGRELVNGLREFAVDQYGRMALTVLTHWGVKTTADFGNIVFNLINAGILGKTSSDSIDDFTNVYDFATAFENAYAEESN